MAAAAAACSGGTGVTLFDYNRKNFMYDRKMRQETEYQVMEFRIQQAELWREDVKDIIGLTSVKMDTYLIVNAVQLGFTVMIFCEGRLASGVPTWLIGCHTLSLAGAFMYLLVSVWLAMHASITAKAYEVRLLTQHVRLPVPTWAQLEGSRTYGSGFEKVNAKQMFRLPFAMGKQEDVLKSGDKLLATEEEEEDDEQPQAHRPSSGSGGKEAAKGASGATPPGSADPWGLEAPGTWIYELDGSLREDPRNLRHLRLVHEAQQYWQSYDGFARVAMSMGTNQLVTTLAYYVIGYILVSSHAGVATLLAVVLFMVIAASLTRLDMSLTGAEYYLAVFLMTGGPLMGIVAAQQWMLQTRTGDLICSVLAPLMYAFHAAWLLLLLHVCKVGEQPGGAMLPTGFRSVMYIDIFGWLRGLRPRRSGLARVNSGMLQGGHHQSPASSSSSEASDPAISGSGPAVKGVTYENGKPVPTRPEAVLGDRGVYDDPIHRDDFGPSTFIPRLTDEGEHEYMKQVEEDEHFLQQRPGFIPWRIFFSGTLVLICLWWAAGVTVLLETQGMDFFKVFPVLRNEEDSGLEVPAPLILRRPRRSKEDVSLIQSTLEGGEEVPTTWPQSRVQPHSLVCSSTSGSRIVSLTQFGVFTATLDDFKPTAGLEFVRAPCDGVEGESLRDATVQCGNSSSGEACQAVVLHRQGMMISTCHLAQNSSDGNGASLASTSSSASSLADAWLAEADGEAERPQEEVNSLAMGECSGGAGGSCTFAETSHHRIVELRTATQGDRARWFPARLVQVPEGEQDVDAALHIGSRQHGRLRVLGDADHAFLGLLRDDEPQDHYDDSGGDKLPFTQRIHVINPSNGSYVGTWGLPSSHHWVSMCSTAKELFLLAEGASPHLWRFPLPPEMLGQSLQASDKVGDGPPEFTQVSSSHQGHGHFLRRYRRSGAQVASRLAAD